MFILLTLVNFPKKQELGHERTELLLYILIRIMYEFFI